MLVYLGIVALISLIVWRLLKPRPEFPVLSGKLPIIGNCLAFLGDSIHVMKTFKRIGEEALSYDGIIALDFGPVRGYAAADPDICASITSNCLDKPFLYDISASHLGTSLFLSKVPLWKQQRKALNPAFSLQSLYNFMDIFNDQGRRLIWQLGAQAFDHYPPIVMSSAETSLQTITGYDFNEAVEISKTFVESIGQLLNLFTARFSKVWLWNDFIYSFTDMKKQEDKYVKIVHGISQQAITNRRLQRKINSIPMKTRALIDHILDQDKSDIFTTDKQIREQLDVFLGASYDTSAITLTYLLTVIGSYPEVQQKIYDEIVEVVRDNDVTKDDLPHLVYLEAVIKETMRLYTVSPVVARQTNTDLKIKDYTIPKGSTIVILIMTLHRHPIWGPDVDKFKPERWLDSSSLPTNLNCFASFSLGKRNCIGKTYAMMSLKVSLVHVLRHYKITGDISKTEFRADVMMKPALGHHITLEQRWNP